MRYRAKNNCEQGGETRRARDIGSTAGPVITTARGLLHLHSCGQWAGLDTFTRALRNHNGNDNVSPAPLTHCAARPGRRMITSFTGQYKLIIRCLTVVIQKCRSDTPACRVTGEELKDCRARVKNYKSWEFVLHINCSQYSGQCPQPTWPSGLS